MKKILITSILVLVCLSLIGPAQSYSYSYSYSYNDPVLQNKTVINDTNDVVPQVMMENDNINLYVDPIQQRCMALAIFHEARDPRQPFSGKKAIASVIFRRLKDPDFPETICKVVFQKCYFSWSCMRSQRYNPDKLHNVLEKKAWEEALELAYDFILEYNNNMFKDNTDGAEFFHAIYVHPGWSHSGYFRKTVQYGDHIFYKKVNISKKG